MGFVYYEQDRSPRGSKLFAFPEVPIKRRHMNKQDKSRKICHSTRKTNSEAPKEP
jgi:hypothetical protein